MAVTRVWSESEGDWILIAGTVDVGGVPVDAELFVSIDGDTMEGPLILEADPIAPLEAATKQYVDAMAGGGAGGVPIGTILPYGGSAAPTGFFLCDGSLKDRTTYAELFAVIGTSYGAGDGTTSFNIPDLIRRFPLGAGTTSDAPRAGTSAPGASGGNINHTHDGPSHTHTGPSHTHTGPSHTHDLGNSASSGGGGATSSGGAHSHSVGDTDARGGHDHTFSDTGTDSFSTGGPSATTLHESGPISGASSGHGHSGSVSISISGTTSAAANHTHNVGGTSASATHTHTIPHHTHDLGSSVAAGTGATGASGTGATGASGTGDTSTANPPYQVVNYMIKY